MKHFVVASFLSLCVSFLLRIFQLSPAPSFCQACTWIMLSVELALLCNVCVCVSRPSFNSTSARPSINCECCVPRAGWWWETQNWRRFFKCCTFSWNLWCEKGPTICISLPFSHKSKHENGNGVKLHVDQATFFSRSQPSKSRQFVPLFGSLGALELIFVWNSVSVMFESRGSDGAEALWNTLSLSLWLDDMAHKIKSF